MNEFGLAVFGIVMAGIGWFLKGLFGPSVDHFGNAIKEYFQNRNKDDYRAYKLYQKLESRINELHIKLGHNRFYETQPHLTDQQITETLLGSDKKLQKKALKVWIEYGRVNSYAQSDVFFAGLYLLREFMTAEDISTVFDKHKSNNQADLWPFLEKLEESKPDLLKGNVVHYLRIRQEEWNNRK